MIRYRRNFVAGGTFFFTVTLGEAVVSQTTSISVSAEITRIALRFIRATIHCLHFARSALATAFFGLLVLVARMKRSEIRDRLPT